jgi:hypothetical protein
VRYLVAGSLTAAAVLLLGAGMTGTASAQPAPSGRPTASPSPKPSPSPEAAKPRFSFGVDSYTSAINQQFVGPGISPAEGPGFILGSPVSPGTPYDFFTRSPLVTGMGIHQAMIVKPSFVVSPVIDVTMGAGYGTIGGSGNVTNYWGDAMMPTLNTHLGARAATIPPAFPTHNGQDGTQASRGSILYGTASMHDGSGAITAGWFDLHQTAGYLFQQSPWTNTPAQMVVTLPKQLGLGQPGTDLTVKPTILPLQGVDGWAKINGNTTIELSDALMPAMPYTSARVTTGSVVVQNTSRITYTAEFSRLTQVGTTLTPVLYGTAPTVTPSAQGPLPNSTLFGQRMIVAGVGAAFPVGTSEMELRYGYSSYGVLGTGVATTSSATGDYMYGKLHHGFAPFDLTLELMRFSPRYAPAILPYGTQENVWNIAWAPRSWFNQYYQFVDNSLIGANRQGWRLSSNFLVKGVEVRLATSTYTQIANYDNTTAFSVGFVEPYFTPQLTASNGTRGVERRFDASFAWHPKFADVRLDLSDLTMRRIGSAGNPAEAVNMDYPGWVFSMSRPINEKLFGSIGTGRFAASGSYNNFGAKNADLSQRVVFLGAQLKSNATSVYQMQYRIYSVNGIPTTPGGPSPAFHGPQFILEQVFKT